MYSVSLQRSVNHIHASSVRNISLYNIFLIENLRYKIINHIFWLNSGLFGGMFIKQASQPINMQGYFNNNKGADTKKTKLCLRG